MADNLPQGFVPDTAPTIPAGFVPDTQASARPHDFHLGLEQGLLKSLGMKSPDPDDPHSIGVGDITSQFLHNTAEGIKNVVADPFNLAKGIGDLASTLEEGFKEYKSAPKGDWEKAGHGLGTMLGAMGQIFGGAEAGKLPGKVAGIAETATEFSPRNIRAGGTVEGAIRPANILEGSINRSVGATKGMARFGNPAQALVDEKIVAPTTPGRLIETYSKLNELKPQLDRALQASPGKVDVQGLIAPIIQQATDVINKSLETPEAKAAALRDLKPLADQSTSLGTASVLDANEFKGRIGTAVNWEKRPAPLPKPVEDAYSKAYGVIKNDVNKNTQGLADLNERVSNLMALKNSLSEAQLDIRVGKGPEAGFGWTQRLEAMLGHVAVPAIAAAQKAAGAASAVAPVAGGANIAAILAAKAAARKNTNTPELPFHPGAGLTPIQ
jgi:hypothetical protein